MNGTNPAGAAGQMPWETPSTDQTSSLERVKQASMGAGIGGGLLMMGGGILFLKTIRATPAQQRKPGKTLMRAGAVLMIAAGASMAGTGGAVYAGAKAIEDRPLVKSIVG